MPNAPKEWPHASTVAIYEYGEALPDSQSKRAQQWASVTWGELRRRVAILSATFRRKGLKAGDRVAHVSANTSNPIVTFYACLAVGCVFSALPTDAGTQAIYGRLSQVQPKVILTDDVAYYNGRKINIIDRVAQVADQLIQDGKVVDDHLDVVYITNKRDPKTARQIKWTGKRARW